MINRWLILFEIFNYKLAMRICASRARRWDDKYYIVYNNMDCGFSLAETVCPYLINYRVKYEECCKQHFEYRVHIFSLKRKLLNE